MWNWKDHISPLKIIIFMLLFCSLKCLLFYSNLKCVKDLFKKTPFRENFFIVGIDLDISDMLFGVNEGRVVHFSFCHLFIRDFRSNKNKLFIHPFPDIKFHSYCDSNFKKKNILNLSFKWTKFAYLTKFSIFRYFIQLIEIKSQLKWNWIEIDCVCGCGVEASFWFGRSHDLLR
jgi:hypothetical protein